MAGLQKKLQIFISSTYTDLIEERQAAVKAILKAGHIPAGMELFAAGDYSQQQLIEEWIRESDVYMLILGGRTGSLMPNGDKSYTQWEYEYAAEVGKPRFALILSDDALQQKGAILGLNKVYEQARPDLYKEFKKNLTDNKIVSFVSNLNEIENAVLISLMEAESRHELSGWIALKGLTRDMLPQQPMEKIINRTFENILIHVDNKDFRHCTFNNCTFVYAGLGVYSMSHCTISGNFNWTFVDAARDMVRLMSNIYSGYGEIGQKVIEETFQAIRNGFHLEGKENI